MSDVRGLEKRISELEDRVRKLEEQIASSEDQEEKAYMEQLFAAAKSLVVKHNKASVLFFQRKLLIDFQRASKLLEQLQKAGVVGENGEIFS